MRLTQDARLSSRLLATISREYLKNAESREGTFRESRDNDAKHSASTMAYYEGSEVLGEISVTLKRCARDIVMYQVACFTLAVLSGFAAAKAWLS